MKSIGKIVIGLVAGAIITAGISLPASAATTALPNDQNGVSTLLANINAARTANGVPALSLNQNVTDVAVNWANTELSNDTPTMYHNPNLAQELAPATQAGEVLSLYYTADAVTNAWLNSASHRSILLSNAWTTMGIAYIPYNGYYVAVVDFATYDNSGTSAYNPPSAPGSVTANINDLSANITWTASTGATQYHVFLYNQGTGATIADTLVDSTTFNYTVTGLQHGTTYYARVAGHNDSGDSLVTASANVSTSAVAPTAPSNTILTQADDTSLTVIWTPADGNGSNIFYYSVKLYQGSSLYTSDSVNTTSKTFVGLPRGYAYTATVSATTVGGTSPLSPVSNAIQLGDPTEISAPSVTTPPAVDLGNDPDATSHAASGTSSATNTAPAYQNPAQNVADTTVSPIVTLVAPTLIQDNSTPGLTVPTVAPSTPAQSVTVTPKPVAAPVPAQPAFKKVSPAKSSAQLSWQNVQTTKVNITKYSLQIQRLVKTHGVYKAAGKTRTVTVNDRTTSKTVTGLVRHARYRVIVTAVEAHGKTASRTVTFNTK